VRAIAILTIGLVVAFAGTIQYQTLDKAVIEQRLQSFALTNAEREHKIHEMFAQAGCPAEDLLELPVRHVRSPNVACSLSGGSETEILVGAHFDFVRAGQGVIDNWSGASLLPSLLESLDKVPRRHRFLFMAFTGEEEGLLGSAAYVKGLSKEQLLQIVAMVNIDSLATGPTKVEVVRGDNRMLLALEAIAQTLHLPLSAVNVHRVGRSDSDSFQNAGVPSVGIHSLTQETFPLLHTIRDRMDQVKLDDYYDSYKLLAAYLAFLDEKLETTPRVSP
jgi:hypothetical protein